jgi:protein-S-isoprenylcysteine O-methyltransferase Ste14
MYLGMLIWLIGFAVLLGSLVVFVFPVLFFLLAELLLIPREERRMEQMCGERFTGYRQSVRRWL